MTKKTKPKGKKIHLKPKHLPPEVAAVEPPTKAKWNGLCPKGHGLDFEGQPCDYCQAEETAALLRQKCPHGVATRIESCDECDRTIRLTASEAATVEEALRGLRQVLELVKAPLVGLGSFPEESPAAEVVERAKEAEALLRKALTPRQPQP